MTMDQQTVQDGQWWASRWRYLLHELDLEVSRTEAGLRVKRIEVAPGRISADVKAGGARECLVEVRVQTWQDEEWQRATDALSRQALYAARLLAGNLPPELERGLAEAGLALLPQRRSDLAAECSCCGGGTTTACPHVRAAFAALGDLLADDPWLLFRLRGRDQAQVLRGLRKYRARSLESAPPRSTYVVPEAENAEPGFYRAGGANGAPALAPSLEAEIHAFWGKAQAQESFHAQVVRPVVELALLRRLGSPEFAGSTGELFDALAEVYRRVTEEGLALAYAADPGWPVSEVEDTV